jgi:competence protein ComEC
MGTAVVAVIGAGAWVATTRPFALAVGSVLLVAVVAPVSEWPTVPQVTVLDVGQGDATLIQDPGGASLLFDGGSHPAILERALRRRGVRRVGVVVVSHGDDDHVGGLSELVERGDVGTLVASRFSADELAVVELARRFGVPVETVAAGDVLQVGGIRVEVLSPSRRFLSDNDGSLVLYVNGEVSVLLPGDVEAIAQNELPDIRADVILVPHHGSSSTDVSWLESTMAQIAILSYGPNRYGHPDPGIIRTLEGMETRVIHTATDGDVDIPLKRPVMRAVAPAP